MMIMGGGKPKKIKLKELPSQQRSLLEILSREGFFVRSYCGGKGRCGKCGVRLIYENGARFCLACVTRQIDAELLKYVEIPEWDEEIAGEVSFLGEKHSGTNNPDKNPALFGIAVDIGTTTIAAVLADMETLTVYGRVSAANSQRLFGADVLSRLEAYKCYANKLCGLVTEDIIFCIEKLLSQSGVLPERVEKVAVTGNTAMLGILLKRDMRSLLAFPFEIDLSLKRYQTLAFDSVFSSGLLKAEVHVAPCISAFIGADVYTGAYNCGMDDLSQNNLYVDIGTNCEILLNSNQRAYAASAAAGPAFEGAGLSCGMSSSGGAVKNVYYDPYRKFTVKTVNGAKPVGICGSGVIDATAVLLSNGFMDLTGLLAEDYFEKGIELAEGVRLTQKDIRNVQLAKSAVYSGIERVIQKSGVGYNKIQNVFLAGSFASNINVENAFKIGLLPEALRGRIILTGNSSLGGALKMLKGNFAASFTGKVTEVILALSEEFQNSFIKNLNFNKSSV